MMFEMLLGHLTGDYLLQNQWMALNKSTNTRTGWLAAIIHCLLYTFAVCLFMWNFHLIWIVLVFCSHFFIDKFGFGEIYMKYIKGNGLRDYIDDVNSHKHFHNTGQEIITGGFKAVVYTLTDNTMHLILMWLGYQILYVW